MSMSGHDLAASTAENYRAFAAEARGRSPHYEALALAAADDPLLLGFLGALPVAKRQPNLLFAAAVTNSPPPCAPGGPRPTSPPGAPPCSPRSRCYPPPVYRGDLLTDVPRLASQAPRGATLVIFHSAVLAYVSMSQRVRFAATVAALDAVWLSNEAPGVLPGSAAYAPDGRGGVLIRDGGTPLALVDGHGTWLGWLG